MNLILAQAVDRDTYLKSMHQQFSNSNPHMWWELLLGVGVLAGIVGVLWVAWFWQRSHGDQVELRPMALYRQVLGRLGLPASDVWRLKRLARVVGIPQPTAVLISSELYDEAVDKYCASRGPFGARTGARAAYADIRSRLFTPDPA